MVEKLAAVICALSLVTFAACIVVIAPESGHEVPVVEPLEKVRSFVVSHDSTLLATLSSYGFQNDILVRDLATRKTLHRLEFHDGLRPAAIDFHREKHSLLAIYVDGTVVAWALDATPPKPVVVGRLTAIGIKITCSMNGRLIAAASDTAEIAVWDTSKPTRLRTFQYSGEPHRLEFGPEGRVLLAVGAEGGIVVYNTADGASRLIPKSDRFRLSTATFPPDGTRILSGDLDGHLRMWDMATESLEWSRRLGNSPLLHVRMLPCGKFAIVGADNQNVLAFSILTKAQPVVVRVASTPISGVVLTADGQLHSSSSLSDVVSGHFEIPPDIEENHSELFE